MRAAVAAAGMGALSNIFYAPEIAHQSRQQYCRALSAVKRNLTDPNRFLVDATLMTVIALYVVLVPTQGRSRSAWVLTRAVMSERRRLRVRGRELRRQCTQYMRIYSAYTRIYTHIQRFR